MILMSWREIELKNQSFKRMRLYSVVVPVYKVPYVLLRNSIESILHQTYGNLDVILVDDGSPDDCGKICDEYAKQDSRVRVIHQQNGGLSVVRNVGVKAALGDWVSFVDGDDWIEPTTYEQVDRMVTAHGDKTDVIAWDGYADFSEQNHKPINFFGEVNTIKMTTLQEKINSVMPEYHTAGLRVALFDVTWARAYRRSLLVDNNIQNIPGLKRAQDLIFNLEVFEFAKNVYYECLPLYHYSMHEEAVTKKYDAAIASKMEQFSLALNEYVENYHPGNAEYKQRMYVKIMPKIVECFGQYYIPLWKKEGFLKSIRTLKSELEIPIFREAVENMDGSGNKRSMKLFQFLLKNRMYMLLLCVCRAQVERKEKWMKRRIKA